MTPVIIGNATLYCGDCLDVFSKIGVGTIDSVITDPPYSTPTVASFGRKVVKRLADLAIQEFYFAEIKKRLAVVMNDAAPLIVFCDDAYYPVLFSIFYDWQQTNLLIWDKGKIGMGNPFRRQHELIFYANRSSLILQEEVSCIPTVLKAGITKEYHGAEKPLALIERLVNGLTAPNSVVFDPFMGSASTGVASLNSGRKFIGCELDREYFDIACKRIEQAQAQQRLFA